MVSSLPPSLPSLLPLLPPSLPSLPPSPSVSGDKNQFSQMKISADHTTWKGYDVADSNYLIQPSVIRPSPNKMFLRAFFRDRRSEHIYWASSADEAHTWTKPEQTGLPNNNAAIEVGALLVTTISDLM